MKSLVISLLLFVVTLSAYSYERAISQNQLIIFADNSDIEDVIELEQVISIRKISSKKNVHLITFPFGYLTEEFLKKKPENLKAYPNIYYRGEFIEYLSSDPMLEKQHYLYHTNTFRAWDINESSKEVIVAVTDDGFDLKHPDLKNSFWKNTKEIPANGIDDDENGYVDDYLGYDFVNKDGDPSSDNLDGAHGTHVAGIISAGHDNGIGVSGLGKNVKVMPLKFYTSKRYDWSSAIVVESYLYAISNGAQIISTSYKIDQFYNDLAYLEVLKRAYRNDVLVFNSAGNSNYDRPKRSEISGVFLVASIKSKGYGKDKKSKFSNYGHEIDISAPGTKILSTGRNGRYVALSGTSMAAPFVAGVAALIKSNFPDFSVEQVAAKLINSGIYIDKKNKKHMNKLGKRVDVQNALSKDNFGRVKIKKILREGKNLKLFFDGVIALDNTFENTISIAGRIFQVDLKKKLSIGKNTVELEIISDVNLDGKLRVDGSKILDPFGRGVLAE